jgi:DNA-binding GntR family transcriptional regulator
VWQASGGRVCRATVRRMSAAGGGRANAGGVRLSGPERVAEELRRAIREGEVLPGEHILQENWASRLGLSRVPVREALKTLAGEGLLSHDAHRGYFVARIAASDMVQIYRMRMLLEPEILRSVIWPGRKQLGGLRGQVLREFEAQKAHNVAGAMEMDRNFYFEIYDLSPVNYIVMEAKRLWAMCDGYRRTSMTLNLEIDPEAEAFYQRHMGIVDALSRKNADQLVSLVLEERRSLLERLGHRVVEPPALVTLSQFA